MEDSDQDTDEKAPPLPGADALRQHIRDTGKSIPEWCEAHGIERISLQRLLKGERQRVSVELAFDLGAVIPCGTLQSGIALSMRRGKGLRRP